MSGSFIARFPGSCGRCNQPITPGQTVAFIDDDLGHVTCPPRPKACGNCHLILPVTGICEDCEP